MLFLISFFLILGIIGGIETGAPMSNAIWALLILAVDGIVIYIKEVKR